MLEVSFPPENVSMVDMRQVEVKRPAKFSVTSSERIGRAYAVSFTLNNITGKDGVFVTLTLAWARH